MTTYEDTINVNAPKAPMTLARFMSPDRPGGFLLIADPVLLTGGLAYSMNHPMAGMAVAGAAAGAIAAQLLMLKSNIRTAFKAMAACAVAGAAVGAFAVSPYVQNERAKAAEAYASTEKAFFSEVRNRPVVDANQLFDYSRNMICSDAKISQVNLPDGRYKLITLPDKTAARVACP